jgi:hypothetical protein
MSSGMRDAAAAAAASPSRLLYTERVLGEEQQDTGDEHSLSSATKSASLQAFSFCSVDAQ